MLKKLLSFSIISSFLVLAACNSNTQSLSNSLLNPPTVDETPVEDPIQALVALENPPFEKSGSTLTGIGRYSNGQYVKFVTKGKNEAVTEVYRNKWSLSETHGTTAIEAETILKLVRQYGYAKEYQELKSRYQSLGLVQ